MLEFVTQLKICDEHEIFVNDKEIQEISLCGVCLRKTSLKWEFFCEVVRKLSSLKSNLNTLS